MHLIPKNKNPTIKTVVCSVFTRKFCIGHFGGHFEYANEPKFHQIMRLPEIDIYENLRTLQLKLRSVERSQGRTKGRNYLLTYALTHLRTYAILRVQAQSYLYTSLANQTICYAGSILWPILWLTKLTLCVVWGILLTYNHWLYMIFKYMYVLAHTLFVLGVYDNMLCFVTNII